MTIGTVESVDPDEARRRAKEILAKTQLGRDPQSEKVEDLRRAALTLDAVAEKYLVRHAISRDLKPKTVADTQR